MNATLELLKHMKGDSIRPKKIQNVYELWMKKIGSMKNWPMKDKFVVQLEFILFCLTRGNLDDAHQAVIGLMQEREFGSDPTSNLVVGMTFCQLWYSYIKMKLPLGDLDESLTSLKAESFEFRSFDQSIANSEHHGAVQGAASPIQCDSNTSVRNDKENVTAKDFVGQDEKDPMDADYYDIKCETPHQNFESRGFYAISSRSNECEETSFISHGGDIPSASIFHAHGLELWLLPLNFPRSNENLEDFINLQRHVHNDYYIGAVKHLRLALYSTPPMFEALLPLIQMLLLGDQVKEALDELEKVVRNSEIALPLRVKARLLEHFYGGNNFANLSTCFEDILKRDPTCAHSLSRLISLHHNGSYSIENLVEMIALHLDATNGGDSKVWKEFACCFLKITQREEDCMSECGNDGGEKEKQSTTHSNTRVRDILIHGGSGKNWRLRCRWWLTRHFSLNILASDITAGDFEILTYKAASASHLYGRDNEYVVKASSCLVKNKNKDMLSLLQMHMQNSVGFYQVFDSSKQNKL